MLIRSTVAELPKALGVTVLLLIMGASGRLYALEADSDDLDPPAAAATTSRPTSSPVLETALWGEDVRIGSRNSIYVTSLDIHRDTGNLFAGLLFEFDSTSTMWSMNISIDGGASWRETYEWWAEYTINCISAAVLGDYCYVAYCRSSLQDQVNLRRFNVLDGTVADFNDSTSFVTVVAVETPETIQQVVLASNQDDADDRLHILALTSEGDLRHLWSDTLAVAWTEDTTGVHDAQESIDLCTNEGYTTYPVLASYISPNDPTSEKISLIGNSGGSWENLHSEVVSAWGEMTALSAYRDTIVCACEDSVAGDMAVRTIWSYDGGSSWVTGDWLDETTTIHESPNITARGGGGVGVVYRYYNSPREGRFRWRAYDGTWSEREIFNDIQINWQKPSIEYLGDHVYGIVYLTLDVDIVQAAYFDRSDWMTGIGDSPSSGRAMPRSFALSQNYPNPFNPSTTIAFDIPGVPGGKRHVGVTVYDVRGRRVRTLIDSDLKPGKYEIHWNGLDDSGEKITSGIYLYTLRTGEKIFTRKMTLVE